MDNKRILNLDFLRGVFVFLALQEHYIHYLNAAFMYYYDSAGLAQPIVEFYKNYENKLIPLSWGQITALFIFVPWVSHGYIALAAFNIAKRKSSDLKSLFFSKLTLFLSIGLFFVLESFVIATDFGEAITVHPLFIWMLLLSVITFIYSYFNITGMILFYLMSFLLTFFIKDLSLSNHIESFIKSFIHNDFSYDARIESFMITSGTGFLVGYIYYHMKKYKYQLLMFFSIFQIIMAYYYGFEIFQIDPLNVENMFRSETIYYSKLGNLFFINFILTTIISSLLILEDYEYKIKNKFFYFISINSLLVFGIHKIFFIKLVIPIRLLIGYVFDIPYTNTYFDSIFYVVLAVVFAWVIKKIKLIEILTKTNNNE